MVVKEYLENEGIKLDRFQQHRRSVKKSARLTKCLEGTYLFLCPGKMTKGKGLLRRGVCSKPPRFKYFKLFPPSNLKDLSTFL